MSQAWTFLLRFLYKNHFDLLERNFDLLMRNACIKDFFDLLIFAIYGEGMDYDPQNPAYAGSIEWLINGRGADRHTRRKWDGARKILLHNQEEHKRAVRYREFLKTDPNLLLLCPGLKMKDFVKPRRMKKISGKKITGRDGQEDQGRNGPEDEGEDGPEDQGRDGQEDEGEDGPDDQGQDVSDKDDDDDFSSYDQGPERNQKGETLEQVIERMEDSDFFHVLRPIPGEKATSLYHAWCRNMFENPEPARKLRRAKRQLIDETVKRVLSEDKNAKILFEMLAEASAKLTNESLTNRPSPITAKWLTFTVSGRHAKLVPALVPRINELLKFGNKRHFAEYRQAVTTIRNKCKLPEKFDFNNSKADINMDDINFSGKALATCAKRAQRNPVAKQRFDDFFEKMAERRNESIKLLDEARATGNVSEREIKKLEKNIAKNSLKVSAMDPHDLIQLIVDRNTEEVGSKFINEAWYAHLRRIQAAVGDMGKSIVLPVIDVSPSMDTGIEDKRFKHTPKQAAIALGVLMAMANTKSPLHGNVMPFAEKAEWVNINKELQKRGAPKPGEPGHLETIVKIITGMDWGNTTNLVNVFVELFKYAKTFKIQEEELNKITVVVLSDQQFNAGTRVPWETSFQSILAIAILYGFKKFKCRLVFWNLKGDIADELPAPANDDNIIHMCGFTPALVEMVLNNCSWCDIASKLDEDTKNAFDEMINRSVYDNPAYRGVDVGTLGKRFEMHD